MSNPIVLNTRSVVDLRVAPSGVCVLGGVNARGVAPSGGQPHQSAAVHATERGGSVFHQRPQQSAQVYTTRRFQGRPPLREYIIV